MQTRFRAEGWHKVKKREEAGHKSRDTSEWKNVISRVYYHFSSTIKNKYFDTRLFHVPAGHL
jgi:hypothetical protein